MDNPKTKIAIFLALTLVMSAILWVPMVQSGDLGLGGGLYVLALMWCPGLAAILTRLITQRNLRGQGWGIRKWRFLGIAYIVPLLYALPVYLLAWATGLGGFTSAHWGTVPFAEGLPAAAQLGLVATLGPLFSLVSATGEEIGWRGLLVPELAKVTSFRNVALISGVIWAAWHMPLLIGANYHGEGTPILFSLVCFAAMILALSVIMAWVTLKSGSLWPAALLHATHNLFVQQVFDAATTNRGATQYLTSEFGVGLIVTIGIAAFLLTRRDSSASAAKPREQFA